MSWVKLGDEFPMHPKVLRVGPTGLALFVSGLCYSSRYLTDGVIETSVIGTLLPISRGQLKTTVNALVAAGLWELHPCGFQVHDYLEYQPSKDATLKKRAEDLARKNGGKVKNS